MKAGLVHVLHVLCPYYMLEHDFRLVFRSAPIRRDVSLEGAYEASSTDLKGDISTDIVLHVDDRCATTETLNVAVCFPLLFSYLFLSSIRWLLTIKKAVLLFRDSLIELFSLKNNALFKKAEIPLNETAGSVDLVLGSFRIKEEDLKE